MLTLKPEEWGLGGVGWLQMTTTPVMIWGWHGVGWHLPPGEAVVMDFVVEELQQQGRMEPVDWAGKGWQGLTSLDLTAVQK